MKLKTKKEALDEMIIKTHNRIEHLYFVLIGVAIFGGLKNE